jgi:glycosyltransferase involved in cell wall biosynthesis
LDHLILASSFNRFAGPNNNLLDVCNYLHNELEVDLAVLTHISDFEGEFLKAVRFPLFSVLRGLPADPFSRFVFSPLNVGVLRRFMRSFGLGSDNLFVNSSIDTLFEASIASGSRVKAGHNVITTGFVTPGTGAFLGILDRMAARLATERVMATTNYQKEIYLGLGIREQDISIIPSCADMSSISKIVDGYNSPSNPRSGPTIFYAGRFVEDKGIRELLFAYEQIVESVPATLRLIGGGPLRAWVQRMKDQIERRHSRARILISAGWQPRETVLREMSKADVVVLPSYHEMCPVSLIEAMCLKRAIVCTRIGGPKEMFSDHVNGILVNPLQVTELKEAIYAILADPALKEELGANAFKTFCRNYDVSVVAPKFKLFLESN